MKGIKIKNKIDTSEGIKVALFRKNKRKTNAHKHNNYFEIIYLTSASGTHTIDAKTYEIKAPIVFTVRKEQIHFWDIHTEPEGYVLIIKKSFIEHCLDQEIKLLIAQLSAHNCLSPQKPILDELFRILLLESDSQKETKQAIVNGILKALLAKLLESTTLSGPDKSKSGVYQKYLELLSQENKLKNKVSHYANLLNTSPQNLNALCRKESKQSASEILSEHILNEAKRLLLYTDLSVSEIALKLDFSDTSHFVKYFKRKAVFIPNAFRKGRT